MFLYGKDLITRKQKLQNGGMWGCFRFSSERSFVALDFLQNVLFPSHIFSGISGDTLKSTMEDMVDYAEERFLFFIFFFTFHKKVKKCVDSHT